MAEHKEPTEPSPENNANHAQDGSNYEQKLQTVSILRIVPGEPDIDTGLVYAETLYSSDPVASDAEEDIVTAEIGYDPKEFPEHIRDDILAGKPFVVELIPMKQQPGYNMPDVLESFRLVEP